MYAPTTLNPSIPLSSLSSSLVDQPPISGVPVARTNATLKISMSMLRYTGIFMPALAMILSAISSTTHPSISLDLICMFCCTWFSWSWRLVFIKWIQSPTRRTLLPVIGDHLRSESQPQNWACGVAISLRPPWMSRFQLRLLHAERTKPLTTHGLGLHSDLSCMFPLSVSASNE